jgi:hypothetical protein
MSVIGFSEIGPILFASGCSSHTSSQFNVLYLTFIRNAIICSGLFGCIQQVTEASKSRQHFDLRPRSTLAPMHCASVHAEFHLTKVLTRSICAGIVADAALT